ncbi:WYL domain-containing protein [Paenibacillus taiwanensis]|uniref:WYL domain-containing protein n=1 Tax=Paenibacillus taiwanensis TaxID=401638 RepID=UPI0003FF123C|nr:WYL domain-containing protein [Paenibacillus taiwanensis]
MNLFEKIFNYQVLARLEDSGTFMITSHERAWLKTMLDHPAAIEAFTAETLDKLRSLLEQDQRMNTSDHLLEKAKSTEGQVYHPLLRPLRRHITNTSGICITYQLKRGQVLSEQSGLPYKLEYSMVKKEWYLLWYHLRRRAFMRTRLNSIVTVSTESIPTEKAELILAHVARTLDSRKSDVVIEIVREYNQELSRILYAFSCFEKDVAYDEEQDTYHVKVSLPGDEMEFLLSKIRFLGKRVRVIEGNYLKRRMLEASTKALERYGADYT